MKKYLTVFISAVKIKTIKIEILLLAVIVFFNSVAFAQEIVWKLKTSLPAACYHGTAVTCNNKIYIFDSADKDFVNLKQVFAYDIANDNWSTKSSIINSNTHIAVSCMNGLIYIFGNGDLCNKTDIYNPETDTWSAGTPMPTGRVHIKSAVVNNKIYVIGGVCLSDNTICSINEAYDPVTDTWEQKTSMPEPKEDFMCTVIDNKIFVFGGNSTGFKPTSSVYTYDPATNSWEKKQSMPATMVYRGIATIGNKVVFAGGYYNDSVTSQVDIYDVEKNTWSQSNSLPKKIREMHCTTYNNNIYILGGISDGPPSTVYNDVYEGILETTSSTIGIKTGSNSIPKDYQLFQNYPNPFNPSTVLSYRLPVSSNVELSIYNLLGQKIKTLVDSHQTTGEHSLVWDATDGNNNAVPSGVYFYSLSLDKINIQNKMMLIR